MVAEVPVLSVLTENIKVSVTGGTGITGNVTILYPIVKLIGESPPLGLAYCVPKYKLFPPDGIGKQPVAPCRYEFKPI